MPSGSLRISILAILAIGLFGCAANVPSNVAPNNGLGKLAPRPLYRDPPFDAPTDPVLCYIAERHKWLMYYTQRRATAPDSPGVIWIHGTRIGVATSGDGGATWRYGGLAGIDYGAADHPDGYTYWAPEVIWMDGTYHMYLAFVPGIFNDWNHPRSIIHLTSNDAMKWTTVGPVDLNSDRVIDPCVMQLANGIWRMWYKDERAKHTLCYADSPDLYHWQARGSAVTDFNGEGPKVFHWRDKYWLIADTWRTGMRVWSSDDCLNWKAQPRTLVGSHGDVVVSGGRAWWFYFGNRRVGTGAASSVPATRPNQSRRNTAINVLELHVIDGQLVPDDPDGPTYIDLKFEREEER